MKDARALSTETARERAALAAERQLARDLRAAERADKERRRGSPACTCAKQGDDAVLASLPSDLAALYDRVKRQLKTPAGRSRTEAFLKWAESHPHDVLEATQDPAHIDLRAIEEEIAATARKLNPYEEKKAARIERMRERAAKKEAAAASSRASAQHVADRIPLGHYAERALMRRRGVVAG